MARLLIDTHVLLWHVLDDPRLGPGPTARIEADDAEVVVSSASLWEIAIKVGVGKLRVPDDLPERAAELGFELLPVTPEHAWEVRRLPDHHRDPFDRLLVAQARVERLPIVSADDALRDYGVRVVWDG